VSLCRRLWYERPPRGQSRHLRSMSAIPPKADITQRGWNVRFVPKADIRHLLDHLVGCDQQPRRNGEVDRLRRSKVDGRSELGGGLYWEIGGFVAAQDTVDIGRRQPEIVVLVGPIGHEAAGHDKKMKRVDRGQFVPDCKRDEEIAMQDGSAIRRQE